MLPGCAIYMGKSKVLWMIFCPGDLSMPEDALGGSGLDGKPHPSRTKVCAARRVIIKVPQLQRSACH